MTIPRMNDRGVIHWARRYDLLIWLVTLGREGRLRTRMLDLARIAAGERILDVGCGTGTLAIAAKRRVGAAGTSVGIDTSLEMIARARAKAGRCAVDATFEIAVAESLPFPDGSFDLVLSTVMLHHLPRATRHLGVREMRRVLRPGGRLLAVDFGKQTGGHGGLVAHFHRHGGVGLSDMIALVTDAGMRAIDSGPVNFGRLQFVLGEA